MNKQSREYNVTNTAILTILQDGIVGLGAKDFFLLIIKILLPARQDQNDNTMGGPQEAWLT